MKPIKISIVALLPLILMMIILLTGCPWSVNDPSLFDDGLIFHYKDYFDKQGSWVLSADNDTCTNSNDTASAVIKEGSLQLAVQQDQCCPEAAAWLILPSPRNPLNKYSQTSFRIVINSFTRSAYGKANLEVAYDSLYFKLDMTYLPEINEQSFVDITYYTWESGEPYVNFNDEYEIDNNAIVFNSDTAVAKNKMSFHVDACGVGSSNNVNLNVEGVTIFSEGLYY